MAEAAGLGKRGKNGLLFNSTWGSRLMFGGIVTTVPLTEMTFPEKDTSGCPQDCFICQDVCPIGAIGRNGNVNRIACARYSMRTPLFSHMVKSKQADGLDISSLFSATAVDGNSLYTCTKCVSACPI
jgi:epoxyqueuosine reductase